MSQAAPSESTIAPRSRGDDPHDGKLTDAIVAIVRFARSARSAFVRWGRLVGSVVTPLGLCVAGATVLCFVVGYGLGWAEFVVIAWTCLVLVLVALLHLIGRNAYSISLSMPVNRVVVGDKAPAQIVVRNPSRRRLPGVNVEIPVGAGLAEFAMPGLAKGAAFDDVFVVPAVRRGIVPIGPVRTVRADPVGLLRRELVWSEVVELYVHPRTIPIPSTSTGFIRDLEGHPTRDLTPSDVSFHALREYAPGDERRFIHWKSTAKTGTFMVRQFEESRRSHLMVAITLAEADYANEEEFELAVSAAGSLGVRAIRDARTVSVVASGAVTEFIRRRDPAMRTLDTVSRIRLLDSLSAVDTDPAAASLVALARVAAESVAGISVAFLVCGSTTTVGQLRMASTSFPLGVEVVAIVCDPGMVPSLRRVAGLSVLTIGFLDDLQKSLARSAAA
ncbi:DUF58 domain-containing protein [Luethyella okanaganae]|uniref:DUF58 domain-containing protein n=1 Tax=Luethyella okanaganae TaxID=69372 RepID=A0ABW1VJX6_9MICO